MKNILDKKYIYVNSILLGTGILFGIIFFIFTSNLDKLYIENEIIEYFSSMASLNSLSLSNVLISFKTNMIYVSIITISSIVFLLSPLILFLNFYKGMQIGFFISSIIYAYNAKGILYSLVSLFPHHLLFVILLVLYSSIMLTYAMKLLLAVKENKNLNIKLYMKRVGVLFLGSSVLSLIISFLEIYLNTFIVNSIF